MSFETHDRSLKYLLAQDPASFIRFGFPSVPTQVLRPVEIDQPVRHRVIDGGYLVQQAHAEQVVQVEFLRRHQSLTEVACEVGQAQLRLHLREQVPVVTMVWDLYGSKHAALLEDRSYWLGPPDGTASSRLAYRRVNLRALPAQELLLHGPPNLYPLVPLTLDGAEEAALRQAAATIEARQDLRPGQKADHLAVLRFLAEAEAVPLAVLHSFLTREKLMESSLYLEIFQEGEAKGRAEGEAQGEARGEARGKAKGRAEGKAESVAKMLIRLILVRLGRVSPEVRQAILAQTQTDPDITSDFGLFAVARSHQPGAAFAGFASKRAWVLSLPLLRGRNLAVSPSVSHFPWCM